MLIITLYLVIDWLRQQATSTKGQCPLRMRYVMYWSSFPIDHRFFICIFLSLVITHHTYHTLVTGIRATQIRSLLVVG